MPKRIGAFRKLPSFRAARGEVGRRESAFDYVLTVAIFLVAYMLREWLEPVLPPGFPFLTFFPAVVIAGFLFGVKHGIIVAVLGGFASWYFFIPPYGTFQLDNGTFVAMLLYIFVVSTDLFLLSLMMSAYRAELIARRDVERMADAQEVMANELDHRLKNVFATMNAIITLSQRHATTASDLAAKLKERLNAMARSSLLLRGRGDAGHRTTLAAVFEQALQPFGLGDSGRIRLSGPQLFTNGQSGVVLSLILHELGTNAAKYGALSVTTGHVALEWRERDQPSENGEALLEITWRERGGPTPVSSNPDRKGFGSTLIPRVLSMLNGEAIINFPEEGAFVTLLVPLTALNDAPASA